MAKELPLTKGYVAIVDDEDFDWLNQWSWSARETGTHVYGKRMERPKTIHLHRFILGIDDTDLEVDHKNRNTLDNRRCNLRICTHSQNMFNKPGVEGSFSKYKGVYLDKENNKYVSRFTYTKPGKPLPDDSVLVEMSEKELRKAWDEEEDKTVTVHVGYFDSEIEAAKAYNKKVEEVIGEFAWLNDV